MRILLPKGEQRKFIEEIISKISLTKVATLCNLSERTIRDWRREKFLMHKNAMLKMSKKTGVPIPKNFEEKDDYWYAVNGSLAGVTACIKKYGRVGGDPVYAKIKWYEWWNNEGKYQKSGCIKGSLPIKTPCFSKDLAEFTGIVMGDGGITKNQVIISTNSKDDRQYGYFVKRLIKKIFDIDASTIYRKDVLVMNIIVSRKKLVEFCNKNLGLKIGNKLKQGLDIPNWIKGNLEFEKACIRGLVDTDGCIFNECHKTKNKLYNYKRLNFTSYSAQLRNSFFDILQKLDLSPRIRNNRCVQVEDKDKIERYFKIIGTRNPKHLLRWRSAPNLARNRS